MTTGYMVTINGKSYDVLVEKKGSAAPARTAAPSSLPSTPVTPVHVAVPDSGSGGNIVAPMPGKVINVEVTIGDVVRKDQVLVVVEAMKMHNPILASTDGQVQKIFVKAGDAIQTGAPLLAIA